MPGVRGKVLVTTRLIPRALEAHGGGLLRGCRQEELTQMGRADAVAFFRAQGVRGAWAEIEAACAPYGYHPLSLRLLAGLIVNDLRQPGDVAAARGLDVSGDLVARRHHVLERAYENLAPARRELMGQLAAFRGAVRYEALAALAASMAEEREPGLEPRPKRRGLFALLFGRRGTAPATGREGPEARPPDAASLDADLRDLVARGLLHRDRRTGRYDLHPIVRRYAYDRLIDKAGTHGRLRDYFAALPQAEQVRSLEELGPAIELYHHTVRAGQYDEARALFRDRLSNPLYYQFGAYRLCIELLGALFPDGEERPPRLEDESAQAWTLNTLAVSYSCSGQPRRAVQLFEASNAIEEQRGNKRGVAVGLVNLADDQLKIGAPRETEASLRRGIALCREIGDAFREANGHWRLGRLLAYRGAWAEAEEALGRALGIFEEEQQVQGQGVTWTYRALRALLMARVGARHASPLQADPVPEALHAARRALELADETARNPGLVYPVRDYVRTHWLLGAAHLASGDTVEADRHLSAALTRCRAINAVDAEAEVLLDLARLRTAAGEWEEAARLAREALTIAERSEYVLQGADVRLTLARMTLQEGDEATALSHAREARRLATCDGPPDYTYQVAYEEAGALLAKLGEAVDG